MSDPAVHVVRRYLRSFQPEPTPTDKALLARYATSRDGDAFAQLVHRHGPMVLGVARRLLGNRADADDAFQAAFLALARGAASIRGESVGGWLHRVTLRVAGRIRARQRPVLAADTPAAATDPDPFADAAWREVRRLLDEELNRLPSRLRDPLVLCYLEALSRDEAARQLGWSLRTLERCLQQGRSELHSRLRHRGVALAGLAAAALTPELRAAIPETTLRSVVSAALACSAARWTWGLGTFSVLGAALTAIAGAAAGLVALLPGASSPAADPQKGPEPVAQAADDIALPEGALRRFGGMGWRHNGGIREAALSADGTTLATVAGATIAVWDVKTGQRRYLFRDCALPPFFEPGNVALAPDGQRLAHLAGGDVACVVCDLDTGRRREFGKRPVAAAPDRSISYRSVRFTPDGKRVVVTDQQAAAVYDAGTGKELDRFGLPGRVVAVSADGTLLATHDPTKPSQLTLYAAAAGKELCKLERDVIEPGAQSWAIRAAFSADGKLLATNVHFEPEVNVWDTATGKHKKTYKRAAAKDGFDERRLVELAFSRDAKTLLAGSLSFSGVRRWNVDTGEELPPLRGHLSSISALLPVPDKDVLISCSQDSTIRRWDLATGQEVPLPLGHAEMVAVAWSPDGRCVVTGDIPSRLLVWDADSGNLLHKLPLTGRFGGAVLCFSRDGKMLAVCQGDHPVALFDPATWRPRAGVIPPKGIPFLFTPDSGRLFVSNNYDHLGLWDLAAGKYVWELSQRATAPAVRPDGKSFAVSTEKGISLRNVADVKETLLIPITPHPSSVTESAFRIDHLAYSPDGRWLAATRWDDGEVSVWNATSGREARRLQGHAAVDPYRVRVGHSALAFSRDGRWLATGHNDRTTRLWELATGKEVFTINHDAAVTGLAFGPGDRTLLTAAGVEVLLWNTRPKPDARAALDVLWTDLASDDAAQAYRAMASLAARGDAAVEFLRGKIQPVPPPQPGELEALVAGLDSDRFAVRDRAKKTLAGLGAAARPALEEALKKGASPETREQIQDLLKRLEAVPAGHTMQPLRGTQVLGWVGGAAAKQLLGLLAAGAPGAALTEEAVTALRALGGS